MEAQTADIILVGAGLANGILTCFLKARHPGLKILILESQAAIPSSRTWCFHQSDVTPEQFEILKPLIAKSWKHYEVRFPASQSKVIDSNYYAIQPSFLQKHLLELPSTEIRFEVHVEQIMLDSVVLSTGEKLSAPCVVDGRGCKDSFAPCGYQKFVGLHLELTAEHGLTSPILMDATVPQLDGYRFIYVLPWGPKALLVEDTRYSENPSLDQEHYKQLILQYAKTHGWNINTIKSEEFGVLPLPLDPKTLERVRTKIPTLGMAAGFFHPVTGYSLPDAVRTAELCAKLPRIDSFTVDGALQKYRKMQAQDWSYLCLLNRMMFRAAVPAERYRIFQRFYTLDKKLVERFYRGKLLLFDKARILMGKPPVPVFAAMNSLRRTSV